jgi:hypothetical protein
MKDFKYPTPQELYALEQWAHRRRAEAQAELVRAVFYAIKRFFSRTLAPSAKSVQKHASNHA